MITDPAARSTTANEVNGAPVHNDSMRSTGPLYTTIRASLHLSISLGISIGISLNISLGISLGISLDIALASALASWGFETWPWPAVAVVV